MMELGEMEWAVKVGSLARVSLSPAKKWQWWAVALDDPPNP